MGTAGYLRELAAKLTGPSIPFLEELRAQRRDARSRPARRVRGDRAVAALVLDQMCKTRLLELAARCRANVIYQKHLLACHSGLEHYHVCQVQTAALTLNTARTAESDW